MKDKKFIYKSNMAEHASMVDHIKKSATMVATKYPEMRPVDAKMLMKLRISGDSCSYFYDQNLEEFKDYPVPLNALIESVAAYIRNPENINKLSGIFCMSRSQGKCMYFHDVYFEHSDYKSEFLSFPLTMLDVLKGEKAVKRVAFIRKIAGYYNYIVPPLPEESQESSESQESQKDDKES
jgi:hypothetical protein